MLILPNAQIWYKQWISFQNFTSQFRSAGTVLKIALMF